MDDIIVTEVNVPEANSLSLDAVRNMIEECSKTEDGESLRTAMSELKVALKANPAACAMLLPEDIGQMVGVLRRMTNKLVLADLSGKKKEAKPKVAITQDQIDNLSAEDLF